MWRIAMSSIDLFRITFSGCSRIKINLFQNKCYTQLPTYFLTLRQLLVLWPIYTETQRETHPRVCVLGGLLYTEN